MSLEDGVLKEENKPLAIQMNNLLADLFIEFHSIKQRHWHVKGIDFKHIHEFWDQITDEVLEWIDDIGEYVVSFGAIAITDPLEIMGRTNIVPSKATERNPIILLQNGLDAMIYLKEFFIRVADLADTVKEYGVTNKVQDFTTEADKFIYKYQSYLGVPN